MTLTALGSPRILSASRRAAGPMDIGNILAMLAPLPLRTLWPGGSTLVYTLHKRHPGAEAGHHTQWAAYRLYGVVGAVVPWSVGSLVRSRRDHREDMVLPAEESTDV